MNTNLPGRLGNPDATLEADSRADPRILAAMAVAGELAPGVEPVGADAGYEECLAYCQAFEDASAVANPAIIGRHARLPDGFHVHRNHQGCG